MVRDAGDELERVTMNLEPLNAEAERISQAARRLSSLWKDYESLRHEVENLQRTVRGAVMNEIEQIEDETARLATISVTLGEALFTVSRAVQRTVTENPEVVTEKFVKTAIEGLRSIGKYSEEELTVMQKILEAAREAVLAASRRKVPGSRRFSVVTKDVEESEGEDRMVAALERIADLVADNIDRLEVEAERIRRHAEKVAAGIERNAV